MRTFQPVRNWVFPDASTEAVIYLKQHLSAETKVCVDLTGWSRPQACVQIHQRSGEDMGAMSQVRCQVDIRAETYDETADLMALTRSWLLEMPLHNSAVLSVIEYQGAQSIEDGDNKPRMMFVIDMRVRGTLRA